MYALLDFSEADAYFLNAFRYSYDSAVALLLGTDIDDLTRGILDDVQLYQRGGGPSVPKDIASEGNTFFFTTGEGNVIAIGNVVTYDNGTVTRLDDFVTFSYVDVTELVPPPVFFG